MKIISSIFKNIYDDTIFKNSLFLIITNFSSLAIGFFFWMVATRLYTPGDVGVISAILSSMSLIAVISSAGLPMALTLYLPRNTKNAGNIINSSLIVAIMISVIVSLIFLFEINIFAPKLKIILGNFGSISIFVMTTMMTTLSLLIGGTFTAGRRSSFQMVKESIFGITKILILIMLTGFGAIGIFISWSLGLVVAIIVGFFLMYKLWRYKPVAEFDPIIKTMTRFSIGNYIAGIFYSLPRFIFPIIIVNLISPESAGYFFIAMTIAGLFFGIPEAVAGPFLADSSDKEKFWFNVRKALKFEMSLLIPGLFLLVIFGKFVLNLFNPNYAVNSFNSLLILSATSIPLSLLTTFMMIRNAQKRVMSSIIVDVFVATVTIILSIPLMKLWNIEGIAISYLVANTIAATIVVLKTKNILEFTLRLIKGERIAQSN
jgi:O-antigen/teichoic acid export membrane protein